MAAGRHHGQGGGDLLHRFSVSLRGRHQASLTTRRTYPRARISWSPERIARAGAASRFSIGVVVVAGMSVGTLFTLFVLPAVYTVLAKDHHAAAHSTRARELAQVS
jgi:hypothetical protein